MTRVVWTTPARANLREIRDYIAVVHAARQFPIAEFHERT